MCFSVLKTDFPLCYGEKDPDKWYDIESPAKSSKEFTGSLLTNYKWTQYHPTLYRPFPPQLTPQSHTSLTPCLEWVCSPAHLSKFRSFGCSKNLPLTQPRLKTTDQFHSCPSENNLYDPNQLSFQQGHSTETAQGSVMESLHSARAAG